MNDTCRCSPAERALAFVIVPGKVADTTELTASADCTRRIAVWSWSHRVMVERSPTDSFLFEQQWHADAMTRLVAFLKSTLAP